MVKICKKCKKLKEHKVRKDKKNFGKPQSHCVECQAKYRKAHYQANKQKYLDKASLYTKKVREFIRSLKDVPCADCGKSYPYYVMQFDHIRDKEFMLVSGANYSMERILDEASKCEVVCANCHMERTHQRSNAIVG